MLGGCLGWAGLLGMIFSLVGCWLLAAGDGGKTDCEPLWPRAMLIPSEGGDESNQEIVSFRFVRACLRARAVCLPSGIRDPKWGPLFSLCLMPFRSFAFPFRTPQTSYPTLVRLIDVLLCHIG